MKMNVIGSKKKAAVCSVAACLLIAVAAWVVAAAPAASVQPSPEQIAGSPSERSEPGSRWSKVYLSVRNMSCGGCIETIQNSVAAVAGTGRVSVSLASGTVSVLYDGRVVADPQSIAQAITDGGYPATIQRTLTSSQNQREIARKAERATVDIASVGRFTVAREDFNTELGHARSRYEQLYGVDTFASPQGQQVLQRIEAQIARRMIDEAIKHQEVDRAGFRLDNDTIDKALSTYVAERDRSMQQFERDLEANGYSVEYFKKKFARRVTLQHYLEDHVYGGSMDPDDREQRYSAWLSNARDLATVVYYDKEIEALAAAGGASCGGTGTCTGGSCTAAQ